MEDKVVVLGVRGRWTGQMKLEKWSKMRGR
jgi:hypothetical protein